MSAFRQFSPRVALFLLAFATGARALEKETSLVTGQQIGGLAVAGRLSIDLHAEFMLSRSYGSETALNWYNCGYSGGGAGGTEVGGNFGDFGFQVPFAGREEKYPHAETAAGARAAHFDGGDFLLGNVVVEDKILNSREMAVEIWFRSEHPMPGDVILGWQSDDGNESSAPVTIPPGFKGSGDWHHLVVNCSNDREIWVLDGRKGASGPRRMIVAPGQRMVLGGASSRNPSFKGELAAVRLHDEAMTDEEIAHNFQGGVALGTEIHSWWRLEPDKWWVKESAHFRHAVDPKEMAAWTDKQRTEFDGRVPEMFDLAERAYETYSERMALRVSLVSVKPEERGDGIKYNIPIQPNEGNVMGSDGHFGWSCQGAGFINPHELVHACQMMTGGMAGNFWETHANMPQTYLGIYQTIPVIMAESPAFPSNGRTYYHDRLMFEHLAQTPAFGPMFVSKLWYDGPSAEEKNPYPWITYTKLNPYKDHPLADEYTRMTMRNVTWDYKIFKEYKPGQPNLPEPEEAGENLYRKMARENATDIQQALLRSRIFLDPIPTEPGWWRVPKEQSPQQLGWNICPLTVQSGVASARLEGYVDPERGGDWRAGFVGVDRAGEPVYGEVFAPGETASFTVPQGLAELYLVVCATPAKIVDIPMTGDFRSSEQAQFPYKVKLGNCEPLDVLIAAKSGESGRPHKNGGGFVAAAAKVDDTAYVGPDARILGNSIVTGNARIEDRAVIRDSTVSGQAVVSGHALVYENSVVSNRAKVRDYAVVKGRTTIAGDARVLEHAVVATGKICGGNVTAKGMASVYGGNQSGTAMLDGYYAKGNDITRGKWFTWSWGEGKNPGEIDEDFGGVYADFDFKKTDGWSARDSFGATWGYLIGNPRIDDSGLRLDGRGQRVELPRDVADFSDFTYTAEVTWNGAGDAARIFEFSAENGDMLCLTPSANGKLVYAINKGKKVEGLSAPALVKDRPTKVGVMMSGDIAKLFVDDVMVAERKDMTLHPDDIRATRCYLGGGFKGDPFGGTIHRFTIHSIALADDEPPSPNPATFAMSPTFVSPDSLTMTATTAVDPLGGVEYYFEEEGRRWNSGWISESTARLPDRNAGRPLLYRVKTRDKSGNETAFSEPARAGGFARETKLTIISTGLPTLIEAEDFTTATADGETAWVLATKEPGHSGAGYMTIPDRGKVNEPCNPKAARLDYALRFAKAGRYYLWIRGNGNNDGGASVHAGLGLEPAPWGRNLRTGHGEYAWSRSPVIEIPAAGEYLFNIWMREDGAILDRLVFTDSPSYQPSAETATTRR